MKRQIPKRSAIESRMTPMQRRAWREPWTDNTVQRQATAETPRPGWTVVLSLNK